jgi:lipopolysaccharide transport system ATP-binding protein
LLELGSGFNPEYTGRDNVILNGLLLGLTREEILRRFDEIVAFAEIGEALDRPVKTYSSGMMMRLAFAVQVLTDPDILIIDEALSVGDFFFQQKCLGYIRALRERGVTVLFVSHDMGTVRDICSRAIYLKNGRLQFAGETRLAIQQYLAEKHAAPAAPSPSAAGAQAGPVPELQAIVRDSVWAAPGYSAGAGRLLAVAFYDAEGRPSTAFRLGSTMTVKVAYRPVPGMPTHVAVAIWNKFDQVVTAVSSPGLGLAAPDIAAGQAMVFEVTLDLQLEAGNYSLMASLSHPTVPNQGSNLDSSPRLGPIAVQWDYASDPAPFLGMVGLPAEATFKALAADPEDAHGD